MDTSLITPETSYDSASTLFDSVTGYDHVTWYVSNAKQAAAFYCIRFGFQEIAYQGLETGSKDICSHVVRKDGIVMVFKSALRARASLPENESLVRDIHNHIESHGDAVKDVAFLVDDVPGVYEAAMEGNAKPIMSPRVLSDMHGQVVLATIQAIGDGTHTLIDRRNYNPIKFLPGFDQPRQMQPYIESLLGDSGIRVIDHCVANQGWNQMDLACEFYEQALGFHKFWSVDDKQICTDFSALRSTVMASANELVKMPVNEPAQGKKKSQIEEFIEFNNGPGIQHLALLTNNIIESITNLRQRGVEFIQIPSSYYTILRERLSHSSVSVKEDLRVLQDLDILIDFDDNGYLLQLFTKPITDRPTIFLEIIQRENFDGFGAGNFKALFESIEQEQMARGTL